MNHRSTRQACRHDWKPRLLLGGLTVAFVQAMLVGCSSGADELAAVAQPAPVAERAEVRLVMKRTSAGFCRSGSDRWPRYARAHFGSSVKERALSDDCQEEAAPDAP